MIDAAGLIQDLRGLLDNISVVEGLDRAMEHRSNTSRREATVDAIDKVVQRVDDAYRRQALVPILTGAYLVHSQANAMGVSNISLVHETSALARLGLDPHGESWANKIDSVADRYTYYDEFRQRVTRLREEVLKGNMDPILGLNPTQILHRISGLRGELLPAIGWDSQKGETYTRLANDPIQKTMRDIDAGNDRSRRSSEEFRKKIRRIFKDNFPTADNPYANAIVAKDYRVYPDALHVEDAGKLANTPEAKRATIVRLITGEIEYLIDSELGISYTQLTDEHRIAMDIHEEINGILVTSVDDGSPAQRAGIKGSDKNVTQGKFELEIGGDIILEVNGKKTETIQQLQNWAESKPTESKLKIYRNGSTIEITLHK